MSSLSRLLDTYRALSQTEREKGTYFEFLIRAYLTSEASYADLYEQVWMYADWARETGRSAHDTGIDLVARTRTGAYHAVQCKLYAADYTLQKKDIDSFFTASGKTPFTHRVIVSTTSQWSRHALDALEDQQPPVSKIDIGDLEASQIDWSHYQPSAPIKLRPKKELRKHQQYALNDVLSGLKDKDRGKLIMACGTGKTFTSLKIAEATAGAGGRVLFLVPSLSLLSQALTEWTQESGIPLHSFAICSDSAVGKRKDHDSDLVPTLTHELRYPATTNAAAFARELSLRHDSRHMSVVFSTYHSIDVVSRAQHEHGVDEFDIIICDEAHRTTGAIFEDEEESAFVRVHDAVYLRGRKRLYMTATPRIYGDNAKATAERDNVALCSMDDPEVYGDQIHVITFSRAVQLGLLVDYKVVVLAIEESHINRRLQKLLSDEDNQVKVDDAAKIVGCWKALAKQGMTEAVQDDHSPMRRAVAFCQVIEPRLGAQTHKVSSKHIAGIFQDVVEAYQASETDEDASKLRCDAEHVDGSMNATKKQQKLDWLKAPSPDGTCRILSNVRCLSEGVDVPALDAVLFLTPRNSQVDVVQSVGRVMRNAPGKRRGYVILPVVIPAGMEPHEALNDNKTYAVVWQVLQALRSHDDRFDAMINKMELDLNRNILQKMEVVAVSDKITPKKRNAQKGATARGGTSIGRKSKKPVDITQTVMEFNIGEIERAIYARVVLKCGNRRHWEEWANDIARIARTHIDRIQALLDDPTQAAARAAFDAFAEELRDDLNDSVTDAEVVEMLAQHLITKPVFDALFADYSFAGQNPISRAMEGVHEVLQGQHLQKEADTLDAFYADVKMRAEGIESAAGKQKIVVELYDKFFRNAFPRMTERLGIVYTPVEVVDFILHSVDHLLRQEFGESIASKGVHVIDPFTGTGTFVTRLMQSGLIPSHDLPGKYRHELHANEIVLLAYYIAAVNIEATYHGLVGGEYAPFEGICLTDTFQLHEKEDLFSNIMLDNACRRERQKKLDIRVVVGNPPYSVGQRSENDNNYNVAYPALDTRIRSTYAERSTAKQMRGLYDSYIRAIRWASDRIVERGIVGFVTNAGFIEATAADGLRKCLAEEYAQIYVFHLRGNQRTSGEQSKREGGKIFGSGSRAPVAISLLVKNPKARSFGNIYLCDIGNYLTREEKLEKIARYGSVEGIGAAGHWRKIAPDEHGDWVGQRSVGFADFLAMVGSKEGEISLFDDQSLGVNTARDSWVYNFSRKTLVRNVQSMLAVYQDHLARLRAGGGENDVEISGFVNNDPSAISWSADLKRHLRRLREIPFMESSVIQATYRPFTKQWMYLDRDINERPGRMALLFPDRQAENRLILVNSKYRGNGCFAIMTDSPSDFHSNGDTKCFPLYIYGPAASDSASDLFQSPATRQRRDGISDAGIAHFRMVYGDTSISGEDVFHYIYGIFHSEDYRTRYANNLGKELPRIPCVKSAADFWSFSRAGRAMAELHVGYDRVAPYAVQIEVRHKAAIPKARKVSSKARPTARTQPKLLAADVHAAPRVWGESLPALQGIPADTFRVVKMRFPRVKRGGKSVPDKTTVEYNDHIAIKGIPEAAYEYVVGGKAAIDWVVERQGVKTDKGSGIVNDANDWAIEKMHNPRYPLELLLRVITVSLETMKIVRSLPALDLPD